MLIGFLYQVGHAPHYTYKSVNMRAPMRVYFDQVKAVHDVEQDILCQWRVIKKFK